MNQRLPELKEAGACIAEYRKLLAVSNGIIYYRAVFAIVLGTLALGSVGCSGNSSNASGNKVTILPVETLQLRAQPEFSYPITFYGRIQTVRSSALSFEVPGRVISLLFDEGENINNGQLMARLDTSILEAEKRKLIASRRVEQSILRRLENGEREEVIAAARAMVLRMEAETQRAILDRNRLEKLRKQNATTQTEYEEAFYGALSLQASLDAAKARFKELESGTRNEDIEAQKNRVAELDAQVALIDVRIQKANMIAPFAAHVVKRLVDEGTIVDKGEPVFTISELGLHEARFAIPVEHLNEAKATTSIQINGIDFPIQSCRVISIVSPETRTVDLVFSLKHSKQLIQGQTCLLTLTETVKKRCFEVPLSALVPSVRGLWSCYRIEKNDANNFYVAREELTINHIDGDRVYVETSLPDESVIVCNGVHKLVPGMLVHPKGKK